MPGRSSWALKLPKGVGNLEFSEILKAGAAIRDSRVRLLHVSDLRRVDLPKSKKSTTHHRKPRKRRAYGG